VAERLLDWMSGLPTVAVYLVLAVLSCVENIFPPVPAEDREGAPHDFSQSATLAGAQELDLAGQGVHDPFLLTAHLGILNSPETWALVGDFLTASNGSVGGPR